MPLGSMKQASFLVNPFGWFQATAVSGPAASAESGITCVNGLHIDSSGNVYVAGTHSWPNASAGLIFVAKYNNTGTQQWYKDYSYINTNNFSGQAFGLDVDSSGNLYITGGQNPYSFLLKLDTNGDTIWQRFVSESSSLISLYKDITVFGSNVAIVGGRDTNLVDATNGNYALYDTDGTLQASRTITQTGSTLWNYQTIANSTSGNVYISGYYTNTTIRGIITKLDTSSNVVWTYRGPTDNDNYIYASTIKPSTGDSGLYVTGWHFRRMWLAEIDANGSLVQQIWLSNTGAANADGYGLGITTDSAGYIYVINYALDGTATNLYKVTAGFSLVWASFMQNQQFTSSLNKIPISINGERLAYGGRQLAQIGSNTYATVTSIGTAQTTTQTLSTTNANLTVKFATKSNVNVSTANLTLASTTVTVANTAFANIAANLTNSVKDLSTGTTTSIVLPPPGSI